MSHLVDIYLQPSKVYADLKEKPTFWLPLLLTVVATAALILLYYTKVDPDWVVSRTVMAAGQDMSAAEREQMREAMPAADTMGYFGAVSAVIGTLLFTAIFALYFMLAGKVTGAAVSFRHGLALSTWSGMPMLLGTIIAIIGVLTMTPQTSLESLMLAHVDPLLVELPMDHKWSGLAKGFSLLTLWTWFLLALGWRTWTRSGWPTAIVIAVLPSVVIFGIMALLA